MFNDFAMPDGFLGLLGGGGGPAVPSEEYLTIEETAQRLKLSAKTLRNKMAAGQLRLGEHYFRPAGMGPRFKWSAIAAWIEGSGAEPNQAPIPSNTLRQQPAPKGDGIPMARGYWIM